MILHKPEKPRYLQYDSLDDRREIHQLLMKLSPRQVLAFLTWACNAARLPHSEIAPKPTKKTVDLAHLAMRDDSAAGRLALEAYMDLWFLSIQWEFNLDLALKKLTELVRWKAHRGKSPLLSA